MGIAKGLEQVIPRAPESAFGAFVLTQATVDDGEIGAGDRDVGGGGAEDLFLDGERLLEKTTCVGVAARFGITRSEVEVFGS